MRSAAVSRPLSPVPRAPAFYGLFSSGYVASAKTTMEPVSDQVMGAYRRPTRAHSVAIALLAVSTSAVAGESTCFGTVSQGRLDHGVRLPLTGPNFSPYSSLGARLGRTYVHSKVLEIVVAAYSALEKSAPGKVFVYGLAIPFHYPQA